MIYYTMRSGGVVLSMKGEEPVELPISWLRGGESMTLGGIHGPAAAQRECCVGCHCLCQLQMRQPRSEFRLEVLWKVAAEAGMRFRRNQVIGVSRAGGLKEKSWSVAVAGARTAR